MFNYLINIKLKRRFFFGASLLVFIFSMLCNVLLAHAEESSMIHSQNITHYHTGNSSRGGGCYSKAETETVTVEERCSGKMIYFADWDRTQCNLCGAGYYGDESYRDCYTTYTHEESNTYYSLGCGCSEGSILGTFTVTQSTIDWTTSLDIECAATTSLTSGSDPYTVNGQPITGNSHTITKNGSYSVGVKTISNTTVSPVTLNITNIDNEAPNLRSIQYDHAMNLPYVEVVINADDIMSDGKAGCGLAPTAYSFDGGNTWTTDNTLKLIENQSINIAVRDNLGNKITHTESINNIDNCGPDISYEISPEDTTYDPVVITWSAIDKGVDGTEGCGLPDDCYSYDDGQTWTKDNIQPANENGTYTVIVRDNNGNTSTKSIEINNIAIRPTPEIIPEDIPGNPVNPPSDVPPAPNPKPSNTPPTPPSTNKTKPTPTNVSKPVVKTTPPHKGDEKKPRITPVPNKPSTNKKNTIEKKIPQKTLQSSTEETSPVAIDNNLSLLSILLIALVTLFVIGLLTLLFFILCRGVNIYNVIRKKHNIYKGLTLVSLKNGVYELNISEKIVNSCDSPVILLRFSSIFIAFHKDEDISVYLPNNQITTVKPGKEARISIKQP